MSVEFKFKEGLLSFPVKDLEELKSSARLSTPYRVHDLTWRILLKPLLSPENLSPEAIGFFLHCDNENKTNWSCYAEAELLLISQTKGGKNFVRNIRHLFNKTETDWGFKNFMSWASMLDPENTFLKNETLIFRVKLKAYDPILAESAAAALHSQKFDLNFGQANDVQKVTLKVDEKINPAELLPPQNEIAIEESNLPSKADGSWKQLQSEYVRLLSELEVSELAFTTMIEKYSKAREKCDDLKQTIRSLTREKEDLKYQVKILEDDLDNAEKVNHDMEKLFLRIQYDNSCLKESAELLSQQSAQMQSQYKEKIHTLELRAEEILQDKHLKQVVNTMFCRKIKTLEKTIESYANEILQYKEDIQKLKEKPNGGSKYYYETIAELQKLCVKRKEEEKPNTEATKDNSTDSLSVDSDPDLKAKTAILNALSKINENFMKQVEE